VAIGHEDDDRRRFDTKDVRLMILPPDFRYRLDYLEANRQSQQPLTPPSIPPFPPTMSPNDAVKQFNRATNFYRDYNYKGPSEKQIVGLNNIGEITFDSALATLGLVIHTVRWNEGGDVADYQWASWRILMQPDDDLVYKDVKASNE
jgi:hypothetical protein